MATPASTTKQTTEKLTITADQPKNRRRSAVSVMVSPAPVSGFVGFLREHAIVGLAVGFVLGTQVQVVVKQLIASFINPLFQLLLPGDKALSARTFTLHFDHRYANFGWGALIYTVVDFLFIAIAIYAIIKLFQLDKLDNPKK